MKKLNLNELRSIQLAILDDVHQFCIEKGIRYSLCGGTMLGAVRHQGYIPWDDDIDLMMPRPDYDRFIREYKSENNYLLDLSKEKAYTEQFLKVCRKGTIMIHLLTESQDWGVNIDIFPIDGLPENTEVYTKKVRSIHKRVMDICPYYLRFKKRTTLQFIKYCLKRLRYPSLLSCLKLKDKLNQMAEAQLPEESPFSTVIYGDFDVYPFRTSLFYELEEQIFEGKSYSCIKDRHTYLSTVYRDYMQLPPVEKRVTHHIYDSFFL